MSIDELLATPSRDAWHALVAHLRAHPDPWSVAGRVQSAVRAWPASTWGHLDIEPLRQCSLTGRWDDPGLAVPGHLDLSWGTLGWTVLGQDLELAAESFELAEGDPPRAAVARLTLGGPLHPDDHRAIPQLVRQLQPVRLELGAVGVDPGLVTKVVRLGVAELAITDEALPVPVVGMLRLGKLRGLSLRAAALGPAHVAALTVSPAFTRALVSLDLADNDLSGAVDRLAAADFASLAHLDLRGTSLDGAAVARLCAAPWAAGLQTLILDANPLSDLDPAVLPTYEGERLRVGDAITRFRNRFGRVAAAVVDRETLLVVQPLPDTIAWEGLTYAERVVVLSLSENHETNTLQIYEHGVCVREWAEFDDPAGEGTHPLDADLDPGDMHPVDHLDRVLVRVLDESYNSPSLFDTPLALFNV